MNCQHCLGGGCIHCRELLAEMSGRQRRSRLDDAGRIALGLFTRPLRRKQKKARANVPIRRSQFMTPVLPAGFAL
jgi:hypothetical protein